MKKIIFVVLIVVMCFTPISAESKSTNIYFEETEAAIIIDQLYESKNVKAYKFIVNNSVEDSYVDVTYYIDDEVIKVDNNILRFQDTTDYFIVGTTLKRVILRSHKSKGNRYGAKDVSELDEGFSQALQNVKYIRKDNDTILNDDLIIQFEYLVNNHKYRIDFKYKI